MDELTRDLILAQDGDLTAFTRVAKSVQPDLRRFCIWHAGQSADVDDLVQEVLLRMFKGLETFRAESRALSWIFTIARRACIDRSRVARREYLLMSALENAITTSQFHVSASTLPISELIRSLPTSLRESFVLVKIFGFSYAEVAEIVGCPLGTVQSRVARARASLASLIEDNSQNQIPLARSEIAS
jgi:RNA polymerase sigma-70 factor (ECF subfamily)